VTFKAEIYTTLQILNRFKNTRHHTLCKWLPRKSWET